MATDARFKFTEPRVQKFAYTQGERKKCNYVIAWDTETPGLGLRVTAAGARRYIFDKRIKQGRSVRVTLDDPRLLKLGDARDRARELAAIVSKGRDPIIEARAERVAAESERLEAARSGLLVSTAWTAYVDDRTPHWGERHRENHTRLTTAGGMKKKRGGNGKTKPGPLAQILSLKLDELTADRIAAWLKRESAKRPAVTAQAYRALRAFIRWCEDYPEYAGIIPGNATSARKVRDHVPRSRAKSDVLQREQLAPWFAAVRALPNPTISALLQTVLLTGARRGEIEGLRWSNVDFQWNSLTIRDKAGTHGVDTGTRTIPLTPYVSTLLTALPRRDENPYVFTSRHRGGGHAVEPRKAHNAALAAAGIPHLTLHGLRRSFGSLAEWVELPAGVVAQLMGHRPSATAEKHYRVRPLDLLRQWHTKLESWLLAEANVPFTHPKAAGKLGVVGAVGDVRPVA